MRWSGGANSYVDAGFVVAGVVGGSAGWWLCLTTRDRPVSYPHYRRHGADHQSRLGHAGGIFGLAVLIHVVMKVFSPGG